MHAAFALVIGLSATVVQMAAAQAGAEQPTAGTVTAVPGPQYKAGWLHRFFLGSHYRDLWTTPVRAEVLDLDTVAGGSDPPSAAEASRPSRFGSRAPTGGISRFGRWTRIPRRFFPPSCGARSSRGWSRIRSAPAIRPRHSSSRRCSRPPACCTPSPGSSSSPTATRASASSSRTSAECSASSRSGPRAETMTRAASPAPADVISTDKLEKRVDRGPSDVVDARSFLTARLVDVYLGDWDRHRDQWRWARFGDEKPAQVGADPSRPRSGLRASSMACCSPSRAAPRRSSSSSGRDIPACSASPGTAATSIGGSSWGSRGRCGIRSRPICSRA